MILDYFTLVYLGERGSVKSGQFFMFLSVLSRRIMLL